MGKAFGKTVVALAAALATVLLALNGAGVVHVRPRVLIGAVVTSAGIACVSTALGAWSQWRLRRLGARRQSAEFQLSATLWAVVDQVASADGTASPGGPGGPPGLDYRDLGLAVYRLRRRWWSPWRPVLVRHHRARAAHRLTASTVAWAPGKGVIGSCVTRGEVVGIDLVELYDSLGDPGRQDWDDAPEDVRMGLSHAEYVDLRDKYAVVVAVPVIDDRGPTTRVRGCVALDGPHGQLAALTSPEVVDLLNTLVQGLLRQGD